MRNDKTRLSKSGNDLAADIGLAPETLVSLTERLKHDLRESKEAGTAAKTGSNLRKKQNRDKKRARSKITDESFSNTATNGIMATFTKGEAQSGTDQRISHSKSKSKRRGPDTTDANDSQQYRTEIPVKPMKNSLQVAGDERQSSLLEDIIALGGTKEDLVLVGGLDSEEEILDGGPKMDTSYSKKRDESDDPV